MLSDDGAHVSHASRLDIVPIDLSQMSEVDRAASMRRLVQIGAVATHRLLPILVTNPFVRDRERRKARFGRGLAEAVTELGVTFVKLGQLIASSPSIAGQTLADAMRGVLDDGPSIPFDQVRAIVEDEL